ncbi:ABC transporter ATP-binding protein [Spongisporangium articulatum]|uniref:ABC transporter ATP-binding protein n=1 Tax=Spongisporangium articulatum TaxID=3362603 RepID=A0ABW8ARH9_9ACTN
MAATFSSREAAPDLVRPRSVAVEVTGLVKAYGGHKAVDGVSLTARAGEVTAVLGPNGAGKTSTIECLEGLRRPDDGALRVLGLDPQRDGAALRPRVGVMLQGGGGLPAAARAGDVLSLIAAMHENPHEPGVLLERLGLTGSARTPVRRLSGGERQRLALAAALVGRPDVVFLDEPTAGLDPQSRVTVWELVAGLRAAGVAVVLTTHLLDEAEKLADHVVLISGGTVVASGSAAALTATEGHVVRFNAPAALPAAALAARLPAAVTVTEPQPGQYLVRGTAECPLTAADVATVTAWCAELGVMPEGLNLGRRSLEDVFFELAGTGVGTEVDRA